MLGYANKHMAVLMLDQIGTGSSVHHQQWRYKYHNPIEPVCGMSVEKKAEILNVPKCLNLEDFFSFTCLYDNK